MYDTSSDSKILLDTVQKFMADEIYPHEDRVDKLGYVPDENILSPSPVIIPTLRSGLSRNSAKAFPRS